MTRMMGRHWKGGKAPCSCCSGGPIARGRALEKREWRKELEPLDDVDIPSTSDHPPPAFQKEPV